ncbi:MAG: hypothetical protein SPL56_00975 [Lachnospiraceae bacterium]|nr:hypothetical protein [Lachnospiraceae bacterium]
MLFFAVDDRKKQRLKVLLMQDFQTAASVLPVDKKAADQKAEGME